MVYDLEQQIDRLEEIKEKWAEIVEKIQEAQSLQDADKFFGSDSNWKDMLSV